ncbi:molybdate ABC transporter substrate-binding protein [Zafaria sp. Z1313]|uniref:molybdate ABC transporter substrate-binding protein n=1 Tax=Zafaria sp. Z1313 TaxID=3423202 RepID=UPI003D303BE6
MKSLRTSAAAVLAAAVLVLSACSGPGAGTGGADGSGTAAPAASIDFFAPASMTDLAPELAAAYAEETGDPSEVVINLASSAQLVQQANAGEVPDVLVTADTPAIDALERPEDYRRLDDAALNRLVIAVPSGSGITSAAGLADADAVALCAPSVPCGRAANAYLEQKGLELGTVSEEDNVRAVLAKVTGGQVDAGFVYATDAAAAGGDITALALDLEFEPNVYPLLVSHDAPEQASAFADWLLGDSAGALFEVAGFERP